MRALIKATAIFLKQIYSDAMLGVLLFVPMVMGLVFHYAVPLLEAYLCSKLSRGSILSPYYQIFDLLLCAMTPVMFSAAGALVILDEADLGISKAYITSPIGRSGYLISRIGVVTVLGTLYCILVAALFKLSSMRFSTISLLALCSGALGATVALMVPSLAKNRVEGMAISKLSGLIMLGLPVDLILDSPQKYIGSFFPSFWMTELATTEKAANVIPALLTSLIISSIFACRFKKKVL